MISLKDDFCPWKPYDAMPAEHQQAVFDSGRTFKATAHSCEGRH